MKRRLSGFEGSIKTVRVLRSYLDERGAAIVDGVDADGAVYDGVRVLGGAIFDPPARRSSEDKGGLGIIVVPETPGSRPILIGMLQARSRTDIKVERTDTGDGDLDETGGLYDLLIGPVGGGLMTIGEDGFIGVRPAADQPVKVDLDGSGVLRVVRKGEGDAERLLMARAFLAKYQELIEVINEMGAAVAKHSLILDAGSAAAAEAIASGLGTALVGEKFAIAAGVAGGGLPLGIFEWLGVDVPGDEVVSGLVRVSAVDDGGT